MKQGSREDVVAKLILARQELQKALRLTALAAVIPDAARSEISVMHDDLDRIIAGLERTQ